MKQSELLLKLDENLSEELAEQRQRPDKQAMERESSGTLRGAEDGETLRRVLVVDDNRDSATSLCMMLELMGSEARAAFDGMSAVEAAADFLPEIILLDIGMPGMNGYETARRIREQAWGSDIKLFALTGWSQEADRRRSEEAGFDGHIIKPIEPSELEKLIRL